MSKVTIDVKKGLYKELTEYGLGTIKLTQKELDKISKEALKDAERELRLARYDGNKEDVIVYRDVSPSGKKWSIVLSGPAALAVEYGSKSPGPNPWWWFSGKGAYISLDAGGAHAKYSRYLREDARFYDVFNERNLKWERRIMEKYYDPVWHYDASGNRRLNEKAELRGGPKEQNADKGKAFNYPSNIKGRPPLKFKRYVPWEGEKALQKPNYGYAFQNAEKKDSYITMGNKPNYIIANAFQFMFSLLDSVGKKYF